MTEKKCGTCGGDHYPVHALEGATACIRSIASRLAALEARQASVTAGSINAPVNWMRAPAADQGFLCDARHEGTQPPIGPGGFVRNGNWWLCELHAAMDGAPVETTPAVEIRPEDLRVESSISGPGVTLTHVPTGIRVMSTEQPTRHKNKSDALRSLREALASHQTVEPAPEKPAPSDPRCDDCEDTGVTTTVDEDGEEVEQVCDNCGPLPTAAPEKPGRVCEPWCGFLYSHSDVPCPTDRPASWMDDIDAGREDYGPPYVDNRGTVSDADANNAFCTVPCANAGRPLNPAAEPVNHEQARAAMMVLLNGAGVGRFAEASQQLDRYINEREAAEKRPHNETCDWIETCRKAEDEAESLRAELAAAKAAALPDGAAEALREWQQVPAQMQNVLIERVGAGNVAGRLLWALAAPGKGT